MTYDIRLESWLPVRRRTGRLEWVSIAMLTDAVDTDPIVEVAAPRPDFNGAIQEFLIGILSAALQPRDEVDWRDLWRQPPDPGTLKAALKTLPAAFDLGGDGPRFLQDLSLADLADLDVSPIERLLLDGPGEQTLKYNKDLFNKRDQVKWLGRPAATMALVAMQTYAPAGGQGNRTSMRGGGPLSTLVDPRTDAAEAEPLWSKLWANVETTKQWNARVPGEASNEPAGVFPWLARTRTSDRNAGGRPTTPLDGHPLQVYFSMPRRIRLEFGPPGTCDITGVKDEHIVIGFRMRNYGVEYTAAWRHPLSPCYRTKDGADWLPVHPQPGGLGWKDWAGLSFDSPSRGKRPAQVVADFTDRARAIGRRTARIHAFGVDFDNMKCRGWVDAQIPLFLVNDPGQAGLVRQTAESLTGGADVVAGSLLAYVKGALFSKPKEANGDFSQIRREFWDDTEDDFRRAFTRVTADGADNEAALAERRRFLECLRVVALRLFDRWCPMDTSVPETLRRTIQARYCLAGVFRGHSKTGEKLFQELELPLESPRVGTT